MSALSALGISAGRPNAEGGVNLRRLDRGDAESRIPVAGMEGIGSEKSIIVCGRGERGVAGEDGDVQRSMATRYARLKGKSEAPDCREKRMCCADQQVK